MGGKRKRKKEKQKRIKQILKAIENNKNIHADSSENNDDFSPDDSSATSVRKIS